MSGRCIPALFASGNHGFSSMRPQPQVWVQATQRQGGCRSEALALTFVDAERIFQAGVAAAFLSTGLLPWGSPAAVLSTIASTWWMQIHSSRRAIQIGAAGALRRVLQIHETSVLRTASQLKVTFFIYVTDSSAITCMRRRQQSADLGWILWGLESSTSDAPTARAAPLPGSAAPQCSSSHQTHRQRWRPAATAQRGRPETGGSGLAAPEPATRASAGQHATALI